MASVARRCLGLNGLWIDAMPDARLEISRSVQVFGGVAFKYINSSLGGKELARECEKAVKFVDVATTSGNKTGSPPDLVKLETISKILNGRIPLALTSGVNSGNATSFRPFIDIFFVNTSISEKSKDLGGHEYLISAKVQELADVIH